MKKRLFALILAVLMLIGVLAACATTTDDSSSDSSSSSSSDNSDSSDNTGESSSDSGESDVINRAPNDLTVSMATQPETIDPTVNSSVDGAIYSIHYFEGLMRYKWDGKGVEPGMAESYDVSINADGDEVWTFHIRDSKWSDGKPVTAHDFEYAYRRLCNPDTAAPYGADMCIFIKNGEAIYEDGMDISQLGVKAVDDKTFEVILQEPCPFFAEICAFPTFMPIRKDIIDQYGEEEWFKKGDTFVSNGPFKMTMFALDDKMESVPNDGYWDAKSVKPTKITWLFLNDEGMLAALRTGEADYIDNIIQEEVAALKADGLYGDIPQLGTYYVSFNFEVEPLNNVNVRKALALAVDTNFITEVIREGTNPTAIAFVGPGFRTALFNTDFRSTGRKYVDPGNYEANKAAAKQALADAGYPNGDGFPKLKYVTNESAAHIAIAEAIQNMWKEVLNINVDIGVMDWATFLADRRDGHYQIARNGWIGDYNDPMTMLSLFLSTSGNNDGNYKSAAFDGLIAASNKEQDPAKRNALLNQAEDVLMDDWAIIPIYHYVDQYAHVKELKGVGISPLAYKFLMGAYKE